MTPARIDEKEKKDGVIVGGPHAGERHDRIDCSDDAILELTEIATSERHRYRLVTSDRGFTWAYVGRRESN